MICTEKYREQIYADINHRNFSEANRSRHQRKMNQFNTVMIAQVCGTNWSSGQLAVFMASPEKSQHMSTTFCPEKQSQCYFQRVVAYFSPQNMQNQRRPHNHFDDKRTSNYMFISRVLLDKWVFCGSYSSAPSDWVVDGLAMWNTLDFVIWQWKSVYWWPPSRNC